MKLNINALVLWAALTLGFHLFGGDWRMGLFIGLCISIIAEFIPNKKKRF
jgi:hypothetical protein